MDTQSASETIIRQIQASGCKEVRIWEETSKNWCDMKPLNIKTDISSIRYKLQEIERKGREKFPFTGRE